MTKKHSVKKIALLQSAGVAAYCTLVAAFMWNAEKMFNGVKSFAGPVLLLGLFCTSVLVCGLTVFYKPYRLFLEGNKKDAIDVVLYTAIFLAVFVIFLLLILFNST